MERCQTPFGLTTLRQRITREGHVVIDSARPTLTNGMKTQESLYKALLKMKSLKYVRRDGEVLKALTRVVLFQQSYCLVVVFFVNVVISFCVGCVILSLVVLATLNCGVTTALVVFPETVCGFIGLESVIVDLMLGVRIF